jgi:4-amino-4-deoxy-L-arabinose transferase-like glycosyltransferase
MFRKFLENILRYIKEDKQWLTSMFFVLAAGFCGIFLRLWWVHSVPTEQLFDFATYQAIAENIYNGNGHVLEGYPVAWQGSGYSYLLAFFYKFMGNTNELTGKYLNVLISSATLFLSYFIYLRFFKKKVYVFAAFIVTAFLPSLISYNNVLGTETLFLFLIACILSVQLYIPNKKIQLILLGVLCGVAALTKPFMLAYPLILAVIYWVEVKRIKQSAIAFGIMALAMVIVVAPWTYRNYQLFGRLIPVSYNSGYVLFINNNDTNVTGSWLDLSAVETTEDIKSEINRLMENGTRNIKTAHDIEPLLKSEADKWIKKNPIEFLKLGILRLKSTFFAGANDISQWAMNGLTPESTNWTEAQFTRNMNTTQAIFDMTISVLSAAGLIYLFAAVKRYAYACFTIRKRIGFADNLIFLNIAFFAVVNFVFEGQARYVFPLLIFFIGALVRLIETWQQKTAEPWD